MVLKKVSLVVVYFLLFSFANFANPSFAQDDKTRNNLLVQLQNIFTKLVDNPKSGVDEVNIDKIFNNLLTYIPEDHPIKPWLKDFLGLNLDSVKLYDSETIKNAEYKLKTISQSNLPTNNEEDELMRELGGLTNKIRHGLSAEEGFAMIDSILSKLPQESDAQDLLSKYIQAFKDNNTRLEDIDKIVHEQSK